MGAAALALLPCRDCGFNQDSWAVRYCTRCGANRRASGYDAFDGLQLDAGLRSAWPQIAPSQGAFGPLPLRLERDEKPLFWLGDGRSAFLLFAAGDRLGLDRMDIRPPRPTRAEVLRGLDPAVLQALTVTPVGAFWGEAGQLWGLRLLSAATMDPVSLLPQGARLTGLAQGVDERLYALAWDEGVLALYGGSGAAALKRLAAAGLAEPPDWLELAVDAAQGRAAIWGAGWSGRVDLARGEFALGPEPRAAAAAATLQQRLKADLGGRFAASEGGALPVPAQVESGWGLLCADNGQFTPAPAALGPPVAAAGLGTGRALALVGSGVAVLSPSSDGELAPATVKRLTTWSRPPVVQASLAVRGARAFALVRCAGEPLRAFLFGVDQDGMPALADQVAVGEAGGPIADPLFPPLMLEHHLAAPAVVEGDLCFWLAPRMVR